MIIVYVSLAAVLVVVMLCLAGITTSLGSIAASLEKITTLNELKGRRENETSKY